jgi:hypothetical protein
MVFILQLSISGLQRNINRFVEPTSWATTPATFSFSSLNTIEACPLQWQLIHSAYGDVPQFPISPKPAAVEGEIIHEVLDLLFKRLALAGLPAIGSAEFGAQIARVNLQQAVAERVSAYYDRVADHPRGGGFRLRVDTQQLVNRVIRLFRAEYPKAIATADAEPLYGGAGLVKTPWRSRSGTRATLRRLL